jgi:hypothetical protein
MFQAGWETFGSEIHKIMMLIWNKEELPYQWKESILSVHILNYRSISLLSTSYKTVSSILGFLRSRSLTVGYSISGRYWKMEWSLVVQCIAYF